MYEAGTVFGMFAAIALFSDASPFLVARDKALMQGEWKPIAARISGKDHELDGSQSLTIKGHELVGGFVLSPAATLISLEPTALLKVMHYRAVVLGRGTVSKLYYEVSVDRLKISEKDGLTYILFKRAKGPAGKPVDPEIDLEIRVLEIYTNVAGRFLAEKNGNTLIARRLNDVSSEVFAKRLLDKGPEAVELRSRPCLRTSNGKQTSLDLGGFQGIIGGALTASPFWTPHGTLVEITPTLRSDGELNLDLNVVLSKAVWPPVRKVETEPKYEATARGTTQARLRAGETLVAGGLTQKRTWTETRPLPFLGRLPAVGSRFSYQHTELFEVELLVLVTPRLVDSTR